MVLFSGAISGWSVGFIPDHLRGRVSGWTNVANLGGGAFGSLAVMSLAPHLGLRRIGVGLAVCVLLGTTPTLFFPGLKNLPSVSGRYLPRHCRRPGAHPERSAA
jgi:hypothetical protein